MIVETCGASKGFVVGFLKDSRFRVVGLGIWICIVEFPIQALILAGEPQNNLKPPRSQTVLSPKAIIIVIIIIMIPMIIFYDYSYSDCCQPPAVKGCCGAERPRAKRC